MSAPDATKPEKSLADQRVDKILSEIANLKAELKQIQAPPKAEIPSKTEHEEKPHHFEPKDLETNCPDCNKSIDDFSLKRIESKPELLKPLEAKILKERATTTNVCEGCGIGVTEEEIKPGAVCPSCGATKYRHR